MTASTWTWIGNTSTPNDSANWSLTSGPGNAKNRPQNGDTGIFSGTGVPPQFIDTQISGGTVLDLTGAGSVVFVNDTQFTNNSSIDSISTINASGTATVLRTQGIFTNSGTIEVTGTGNHLGITIAPDGTLGGSFENFGTILIDQGDSLTIDATGGGTLTDFGSVAVAGGHALIDANTATLAGAANFSVSDGGSLEFNQTGTMTQPHVTFNGPGTLKLDQPANFSGTIDGAGTIDGFALGDTIDLGVLNVTSVVFDGQSNIDLIGAGGVTLFSAHGNSGLLGNGGSGTFALAGTGGIAGNVIVTEGGGGDTVLTAAPPRVWLWNGASASVETPGAWSVLTGPPFPGGAPGPGDTAVIAAGTAVAAGQFQLNSNTIELGGTAGTAALIASPGTGGGGNQPPSFQNPSLDRTSMIESAVMSFGTFVGQTTAESSLISIVGPFVNEGTIIANGPPGSNFTIAVSGTTVAGTFQPGTFINYNAMEVDAGNAMTITVGADSEFYNVSEILVNGGSLRFLAAAGAVDGGYAGDAGAIVIVGGGTVETNAAYAPNSQSVAPVYAFADATAGNTLKIDNLGSFGGLILNFGTNDTIDLGTSLSVGTIVYSAKTGVLNLENGTGTIIDSLAFASGNFQSGTFAVSGGTAGSFIFSTGTDGNTVLTTSVPGGDVFNNTSGSWQAAGLWSNGVPGTLDTALIGFNSPGPFTLTTGTAPVSAGTPIMTDGTLQITSATTFGPYAFRQFGGTVEVTSGNTLTEAQLALFGGTDTIDPGATLDLTGHVVFGFTGAVNGTIAASPQGTRAVAMGSGTLLVNGGILNGAPGQTGGNGGNFNLGVDGGGTPATVIVQSNGANAGVATFASTNIGSDPTSFGSLTLNGGGVAGGATWTDAIDANQATLLTTGFMIVGFNNQATQYATISPPPFSAAATLVVENGATLTEQSYAIIGQSQDSAGSVQVAGGLWAIGTGANGGFLTVGDSATATGSLEVDGGGTVAIGAGGTFFSNGTTFTGSSINIGQSAASTGTVTVRDGGVITDGAGMNVGASGQGALQILNGGTVSLTGTAGVGVGLTAGSFGTVVVSGQSNGASAVLNFGATARGIAAGTSGTGTVDVESGGTILMNGTGGISVGQSAGAVGLFIVNGPNAVVTQGASGGGLGVGGAGNGTLVVENGGQITLGGTTAGAGIGVGQTAGANGVVTVTGTGAAIVVNGTADAINVGISSQGTFQVLSGGSVSVSGNGVGTGNSATGNGTVIVSGLGSSLTTTGKNAGLGIGNNGIGAVTISAGGAVSIAASVNIANNASASGSLLVDNGSLTAGVGLTVGNFGTGSMTIQNGGRVSDLGSIGVSVGGFNGGTGSLIINGGTLNDAGHQFMLGNTNSKGTLLVEGGGTLFSGGTLGFSDINASGTGTAAATVTGAGAAWVVSGQLIVGDAGSGSLDINTNGLVNTASNNVTIGNQSTGKGTLSLESGGSLHAGTVSVVNAIAPGATGLLSVAGGTVNSGALAAGGGGTVSISSGTLATGNAVIGSGGSGATLTQSGGTVTALSVTVGNASGGSANLAMTGGQMTAFFGPVAIGATGNGSATIGAGASLVAQGGLSVDSGGANASGAMTIGGAASVTGQVTVGSGGNASLTVQAGGSMIVNGSTSSATQIQVGAGAGGNASLTVNGGTFSSTNEGLAIGNGGNAAVLVENGGTLNTGFSVGGPGVTIAAAGGNQASVQVTGANSVWNLTSPNAGFLVDANGSVSVSAGGVVNAGTAEVDIGFQAGGSGTVAISNGGSFSVASPGSPPGNGDTLVSLASALVVGAGVGSNGVLSVSGAGSRLTAIGQLTVGGSGSGTLSIAAGATVQAGGASFNTSQGVAIGNGSISVSGTQSVLTNTGEFIVGLFTVGSLSVQSGGTLITSSGGVSGLAGMEIGVESAADGSQVTVSGAGSRATIVGLLDVGRSASGGLQISAGATVTADSLDAGNSGNAVGQIGVTGAGSSLLIANDATVADDATGVLSVLSGATFSAASLTIGSQGNSSGALVVSGAGSVVNLTGAINIGTALGTGDLTVGPGAAVHASVVNLQGQVVLEGGLLDPTVNLINQGQTAGGFGTLAAGDIVDEGVIQAGGTKPTQRLLLVQGTVVGGGTLSKNGTVLPSSPAGLLQINAGGTMELTGPVLNAATTTFQDALTPTGTYTITNSVIDVSFADAAGVLLLDDIAGFGGTITTFKAGDQFVITGGTLSGVGISNGNTLTFADSGVNAGAGGIDRIIFGSPVNAGQFNIVSGNTVQAVACFAVGTRIGVEDGWVAVEELRAGDRVVTADGRIAPIVWLGSRTVDCRGHPRAETVRPVRVGAGAFGRNVPVRDLYLSPDHAVYVGDVLVPVKLLINGTSIAQVERVTVTYYHVELERHEVILADGLPVESYLDLGDRANFQQNATTRLLPDFTARLSPDTAGVWETRGAAPLVTTGPALAAARRMIAPDSPRHRTRRPGAVRRVVG